MKVEIADGRGERALIEGLVRFYVYDFSEMEPPGSDVLDFNAEGEFGPLPGLDAQWHDPDFHPLLIRADGKVAGFAFVNRLSHLAETVERNMDEFFVARKFRRTGVARAAARLIFQAFPGRWEVAVVARNPGAQAFWPRAIEGAPGVEEVRRHAGDGMRWTGPVWTFTARAG